MDQFSWAAALVKISHNLIVQFRDHDVQKQRNCRVVVDANLNFSLVLFLNEFITNALFHKMKSSCTNIVLRSKRMQSGKNQRCPIIS